MKTYKCVECGLKFTKEDYKNARNGDPSPVGDFDWCASLDRVDFSKGYIKGNIRWILNCINTLKRQKDDAFVIKIAEAITKHQFSRESQKP